MNTIISSLVKKAQSFLLKSNSYYNFFTNCWAVQDQARLIKEAWVGMDLLIMSLAHPCNQIQ